MARSCSVFTVLLGCRCVDARLDDDAADDDDDAAAADGAFGLVAVLIYLAATLPRLLAFFKFTFKLEQPKEKQKRYTL